MAKQRLDLRKIATDPFAQLKHERVSVPEWSQDGKPAELVVRQLTGGDWIDYRAVIDRSRRKALAQVEGDVEKLQAQIVDLSEALEIADRVYQRVCEPVLADGELPEGWREQAKVEARRLAEALTTANHAGMPNTNVMPATALVLVRTLFYPDGSRVLLDDDAENIAASFSEVHGRLADKAFELSGLKVVPQQAEAEAGKG